MTSECPQTRAFHAHYASLNMRRSRDPKRGADPEKPGLRK